MFNLTSKKNMKKVLLVCVCTAMLASCGQNSADYKKLKAENDSLRIENTKNTDLDRSSFNTEPGLRSISFSIFQSLIPAHFCVGFFIFCLARFLRRAVRDGESAAVLFLSLFFYFPFGSVCGILCALQEIAVN